MPRQKTIKRFEQWKEEAANVDGFFKLMEGTATVPGKRFRDACVVLKMPYTLMHAFVLGDEKLRARYDAVLAAKADDMMHESLKIARGVRKTNIPARVSAAKLEVETMHAVASKWDRDRYGETLRVEKAVTIGVDAALLGTASELLRLVAGGRPMKVIEGEAVHAAEALPPAEDVLARLPAAKVG